MWFVDTLDWETQNADSTVQNVMDNASDGQIILMHDIFKESVDAAEIFIPQLLQEGYQLVTVSELAAAKELHWKTEPLMDRFDLACPKFKRLIVQARTAF